jgi:hypothetical protein
MTPLYDCGAHHAARLRVDDADSFAGVDAWERSISDTLMEPIPLILVANKDKAAVGEGKDKAAARRDKRGHRRGAEPCSGRSETSPCGGRARAAPRAHTNRVSRENGSWQKPLIAFSSEQKAMRDRLRPQLSLIAGGAFLNCHSQSQSKSRLCSVAYSSTHPSWARGHPIPPWRARIRVRSPRPRSDQAPARRASFSRPAAARSNR